MDAHSYLKSRGKEAAERLATLAGTNFVYFSQIANGHRKPSPDLAKKLVAASEGELTLIELRPDIYGEPHSERAS